MKVCILTYEFFPVENGITISVERIARNLSNKGIEVHVLTFDEKKSGNRLYNEKTILNTAKGDYYVHRISPFSGNMQYPAPQEMETMLAYLKDLHQRYKFDILHGFRLVPSGYIAVLGSGLLKIPCVVSSRGNDIGRNAFDPILLPMTKFVLEKAGHATFVTKDLQEIASVIADIGDKSSVIHNSFDVKKYYALKKPKKFDLKGLVVGTSGMIRSKKGFSYMLEAYERFAKEHESTFFLIGDFQAEEKQYYENMIKSTLKNGAFIKTGVISHRYVLNYMKELDIFLLPSLTEGCSNSMLEAMYLKVPIIATHVGAARDLIQDSVNGLLVKTRDSDSIYGAMLRLVDKKTSRKLTFNSKKLLSHGLSVDAEMENWLGTYSKVMKR